jgi:ABC-2 type transport system ATP-binding protein
MTGTMSAPAAIRTRSLEKRYRDHIAVRALDLDIHPGEVFGLLGPNGAGKTTTILMLLGLTQPSGGSAEVLGHDPGRDPLYVKRRVGYLPDNVGFYGNLTGRENLRYTARLNGIPEREARDLIAGLLERVGLTDAANDPVGTYSRGMRQRLGLADTLVKAPRVLILDEPTTAIDPVGVAETLALVREMAHEQGVAVLLSSHLLDQVQQVCDRMAIFVAGEVVAQGTVAELAAAQSSGAQVTLEIGAEGERAAVADLLRGLPGTTAVDLDPHDARLVVVTGHPQVRGEALQGLLAAGYAPWLVRDRGMRLDEVYQRYFAVPALRPSAAAAAAVKEGNR